MKLELLPQTFCVCKVDKLPPLTPFSFVAVTDCEISLVTDCPPPSCIAIESDWRCFRVKGTLEFSAVGILAQLSSALAKNNIPLFVVSTFDTDFILVKSQYVAASFNALESSGVTIATYPSYPSHS